MKKIIMAMASLVAITGMTVVALPQKADAASRPCTQQVLKAGASNPCVEDLQFMLNFANKAGLETDGEFGPKTRAAVKKWQAKKGIKADGVVGLVTWSTLCSARVGSAQRVYDQFTGTVGCPVNPPLESIARNSR